MTAGIYSITNIVNGAKYVGQAININRRWLGHKRCLSQGDHDNRRLQNAWDKYGPEAFLFEVVLPYEMTGDKQHDRMSLTLYEQYFIDAIWPVSTRSPRPERVYNLCSTASSNLGRKFERTPERLEKWRNNGRRNAHKIAAMMTYEQRLERGWKGALSLSPEELSNNGRKGAAAMLRSTTHEERSKLAHQRNVARFRNSTREQRLQWVKDMRAALTAKKLSDAGRNRALATNHTRWHSKRNTVNPSCAYCQKVAA